MRPLDDSSPDCPAPVARGDVALPPDQPLARAILGVVQQPSAVPHSRRTNPHRLEGTTTVLADHGFSRVVLRSVQPGLGCQANVAIEAQRSLLRWACDECADLSIAAWTAARHSGVGFGTDDLSGESQAADPR